MSRLTRVPGTFAEYALVDASEVRAIEPVADMPGRCDVHMSGSKVRCAVTVQEAADLLGLSTIPAMKGDIEKMHGLLMDRAEAILDAWKVGGEKLHEAILDLDSEVASQKGAMYE